MMPAWKEVYNKHGIRLIEGDCQDFLPTLDKESVTLLLSDVPYGHDNNNGDLIHQLEKAIPARRRKSDFAELRKDSKRLALRKDLNYEARPIANDGAEANDLVKFIIHQAQRLLVKGGNIALCCSGGGGPNTIEYATWSLWLDEVLTFKQMVIWDKGKMGIGWHYRRSYELMLVATKPGAACKWFDESDRVENILRPGDYNIRKIIPAEGEHPCAKPVELAMHFIRLHTQPGDTVLDPCAGAGWVAEACRIMGRKFIGVEIDPHWCHVMCQRVRSAAMERGFGGALP